MVGQIRVRPFPNVDAGRIPIATGTKPVWSPKRGELFYIDEKNFLTTVPVQTTPTFKVGNPTQLFELKSVPAVSSGRRYDVSRDAQRFVVIKDLPVSSGGQTGEAPPTMVVVLNWIEELRAKVGSK